MSNTCCPVVHFELPYDDRERIVNFYREVFDWEIELLGPEMDNYALVRQPKEDVTPDAVKGAVGGGFFPRSPGNEAPSVVIRVADVRTAMEKIAAAGGKILGGDHNTSGEPDDIPGVGLYCRFLDTEGNNNSILQPSSRHGA
ncbi:VOC family protein [Pelagibacterium halotolerans]|uniref:VOC family protein n=1 Tax=Pelagibacterium halotolerans TaxID=531813 RepID=UPI00384B09EA